MLRALAHRAGRRQEGGDRMAVQIVAHRGVWQTPEQGNQWPALAGAWSQRWGVETDIRDYRGELIVHHDVPPASLTAPTRLSEVLAGFVRAGQPAWLALNIKSDGLAEAIAAAAQPLGLSRYFCFDMSIPDSLPYLRRGVPVFVRQSEYELEPALYEQAAGIWLDSFSSDWFSAELIRQHLRRGKHVCVVSPELHRRDPLRVWSSVAEAAASASDHAQLMICTDKSTEFSRLPCAFEPSSSTWMAS